MTPEQKEKFRIFLYDETTASFDNRDDVGKIIKWVEDNIENAPLTGKKESEASLWADVRDIFKEPGALQVLRKRFIITRKNK